MNQKIYKLRLLPGDYSRAPIQNQIFHVMCPGVSMKILVPNFGVLSAKILEPEDLYFSFTILQLSHKYLHNATLYRQSILCRQSQKNKEKTALQTAMSASH